MISEAEMDRATQKRSLALDHAMRLFNLQVFSHLYALLGNKRIYILDDDRLLR